MPGARQTGTQKIDSTSPPLNLVKGALRCRSRPISRHSVADTGEWSQLASAPAVWALPWAVALALALLGWWRVPSASSQEPGPVRVMALKGVVDPVMARYVTREIDAAHQAGAQCLIMQLDTPGGLDASMRAIIQKMMGSPVPIVVYVSPAGARAGSAGVFITLAGHVAAMAPGTNIGAAHPVNLTGGETPAAMEGKITNDAAAYIRAIAQKRGRNAEWAEKAVRESESITADEALEMGVIDLLADDLTDLLGQLDGRKVVTAWGEHVLHTGDASPVQVDMAWFEKLLHVIVDPTIAYLLLTLGIWALVAEFYHPGAVIPAVTGVICLLLAFVAFGSLPINWAGIVLIIVAVTMFILDIKVAGFALSVGGAIAFVLGSLMLFRPFRPGSPTLPALYVNPWAVGVMTVGLLAFFLFVVSAGVRAQRARVVSGAGSFVGATGRATSDLAPVGTVLLRSEDWTAEAVGEPIGKGEEVEVVGVDGVRLQVVKRDSDNR